MPITLEDQPITVRSAAPNEVTLVLAFIKKKAAFDRNMGSFSGTLQTSEEKIHKTILGPQPFAYFLIALRKAAGLTQEELAERLHTKKSNISRLENVNSPTSPTLTTIEAYAEAVGYRVEIHFLPVPHSTPSPLRGALR